MNLLIDSGNSFIKWACQSDDVREPVSRVPTKDASSLDESWKAYDVPDRVLVSNVAGVDVARYIAEEVSKLWQLDAEFVSSQEACCGLVSNYHKVDQLGVDRWMAMVGAYDNAIGRTTTVVIDCGTAVTVDVVNSDGVFIGGVIMPGLVTALNALRLAAEAIEGVYQNTLDVVEYPLTTNEGVIAGVIYGITAGVEKAVTQLCSRMEGEIVVYLTGGDAERLQPFLNMHTVYLPELVFEGLRLYSSETS